MECFPGPAHRVMAKGTPMGNLYRSTALSCALIFTSLAGAEAADFRFPPQPSVSVPSPVPVPEYSNGWYFRGDIAYAFSEDPDLRQSGARVGGDSMDNTWDFGAGFGYIFDEHFRGDVTVDYRLDADVSGADSITGSRYQTDVASTTVLANLYYDILSRDRFTPYVGAGIGFSYNETDELAILLGGAPAGSVGGDSTTDFAAAAMAGFSYKMSEGWLVDAGYRYLYVGDAKTGDNAAIRTLKIGDIGAHEIRVGLRYEFR